MLGQLVIWHRCLTCWNEILFYYILWKRLVPHPPYICKNNMSKANCASVAKNKINGGITQAQMFIEIKTRHLINWPRVHHLGYMPANLSWFPQLYPSFVLVVLQPLQIHFLIRLPHVCLRKNLWHVINEMLSFYLYFLFIYFLWCAY